ncbi:hypothetical protein BU103_13070 [Staphylococcus xylosus]|nr:hypothetical protein BU103_13070 [Staphylococcus xylosus]
MLENQYIDLNLIMELENIILTNSKLHFNIHVEFDKLNLKKANLKAPKESIIKKNYSLITILWLPR